MKRQATYNFKRKAQRFTIRKLNIGLASVVFGTLFYLNVSEDLQAAETLNASPTSLQKEGENPSKNTLNYQAETHDGLKDNVITPTHLNNPIPADQKTTGHHFTSPIERQMTSLRSAQPDTFEADVLQTPTVHIQQAGNQRINGTAQPKVTVVARVNEGQKLETTATADGMWSITVPTPLIMNDTITAYAVNSAGQQSGTYSTHVIDTLPPNPPGVSYLEIGKNIITGTGDQYRNRIVAWFPDGQMMWTKVGKNGTWMMGVPYETQMKLKVGDVVQVYEYDTANNRSEVAYVHIVEAPSPVTSIEAPQPDNTESTSEVSVLQEEESASVVETVSSEIEKVEEIVPSAPELSESLTAPLQEEDISQEAETTPVNVPVPHENQIRAEPETSILVETASETIESVEDNASDTVTSQAEISSEAPELVSSRETAEVATPPSTITLDTKVIEAPTSAAPLNHETISVPVSEEALQNDMGADDAQAFILIPLLVDESVCETSITNTIDGAATPKEQWMNIDDASSDGIEHGIVLNHIMMLEEDEKGIHGMMTDKGLPMSNKVGASGGKYFKHAYVKNNTSHDSTVHGARGKKLPETGNMNESLVMSLGSIVFGVALLYRTFKRRKHLNLMK
ncbi:YSIRK-type signal peptide-containing protein [Staphylococcus agnetis]|uniref:YSIRK-type signal peptide-containing protein n=1 Tax=Staphylococcus agnetis TaxID=985762 RepID=UPI00208FAB09|nr:YSIRK-type signal peptide-containing protein [Staphylococcus agnetis]MCO4340236.1 YSIRK-type signal peptide-containing protein [Staphylococcus agnetis]MCO4343822.1 YSIRK-type signal peptide-containing protein [Staphylococcus agnetis]MCO4346681.1 YSIRK-type signal peptide-containing protein [Staphylococcus agnetis]MCO4349637.1 YSIRK-type signal peptide-containing protein [Staphylococcus agnetis]MCO4353088.1 YSIRK-type signal peptide-containing protein [Staphylococcus agnetis]